MRKTSRMIFTGVSVALAGTAALAYFGGHSLTVAVLIVRRGRCGEHRR